ncbi:MAG: bile acid:sodium symporter [Prochlorococcaceae cyanobacterium]
MAQAAALLAPATLFAIMFALGLGLPDGIRDLIRRRCALLLRVLLGSCVLVPLAVVLLLQLPLSELLSQPARFGLALMAVCPSAPLTMRKAGKAGGSCALAATLQVSAALAAIVSIPLMAFLITTLHGVEGWDILPRQVALQIGIAQILPLALGMVVRRRWPAWAASQIDFFDRLANVLLLILVVAVLLKTGHLLVPFVSRNLLALAVMAVMVLVSMAIGFLLAGRDREEQTTAALVTSMRNPGLALLFAGIYGPSIEGLKLAILVYLLVTVVVHIPFLRWRRQVAAS